MQLARLADRLGYTRFWVSEHHNTPTLAGSTPEVLIAHLCSQTSRIRRGERGTFPTAAEVAAYQFTTEDKAHLSFNRNRVVSGTPGQVHAQLTELAAEYGVDEITAVTITARFEDRVRSYELLAEAFELDPVAAAREHMLA